MKLCRNCQAELADEAKICRECGEIQPADNSSSSNAFAMPYLSSNITVHSKPDKKISDQPESKEPVNIPETKEEKKERKIAVDQITDPRERAFAKQNRRNKLIRIATLIIAAAVVVVLAVFLLTRSTGYHKALDKYIDGRTQSGGTAYASIVPELYLINAEKLYSMSRPEIRSNTGNYLEYVEDQMESNFGSGLDFSYKIISEAVVTDEKSLDSLEESIKSVYGTELVISEAAYLNVRLTTKGSVTQETETLEMTFFEYDGKWYCMDAMEIIKFACENSGYGLW